MFRQFQSHPWALGGAVFVTFLLLSGIARLAGDQGGLALLARAGESASQQVVIVGHRMAQEVVVVGHRVAQQVIVVGRRLGGH